MTNSDGSATSQNPPAGGESHANLMAGESQPLPVADHRAKAKPDGNRQGVAQNEKCGRRRVHNLSIAGSTRNHSFPLCWL